MQLDRSNIEAFWQKVSAHALIHPFIIECTSSVSRWQDIHDSSDPQKLDKAQTKAEQWNYLPQTSQQNLTTDEVLIKSDFGTYELAQLMSSEIDVANLVVRLRVVHTYEENT